jgi:transcriptional regulator with XRE-family HTH domain
VVYNLSLIGGATMKLLMKEIRKARGLSQKQLGELVNASERQIGYWENGGGFPLEQAYSVTAALGCTLDELVGREPPAFVYSDPRQNALNASYQSLNNEGQEKAAEQLELITGNLRYKKRSQHGVAQNETA